jgi:hypothetical protein
MSQPDRRYRALTRLCRGPTTRVVAVPLTSLDLSELGGLLPGIKVQTSATDFAPISQLQLEKFKGERWDLFGDIISGDVGG